MRRGGLNRRFIVDLLGGLLECNAIHAHEACFNRGTSLGAALEEPTLDKHDVCALAHGSGDEALRLALASQSGEHLAHDALCI